MGQKQNCYQMQEVFPTNPEWNYILFKLQVILADPSVELLRLHKHPSAFAPAHDSHMKVDAAIEVTSLPEPELDNLRYGNPTKHIFEAGHIRIDKETEKANERRRMLLFKLAINECMPIHKSGVNSLSTLSEFPPDVDTIYVSDSREELNIYPHKFKVKERSQACLEYEVEYAVRGMKAVRRWDPDRIICEYCNIEKAKYYCAEEQQLFCGKCFEESHRSSRKKDHSRLPITPYNSSSSCPFHSKERLTHYCFECGELRCERCLLSEKMKSENKHKENILLVELAASFHEKQSIFLEEAKAKTKALLSKVEAKIKSIGKYYDNQQKDLEDRFAAKLGKVREESNRQISKCLSAHAELKRKLDQFLWLETFMQYCEGFMTADDSIRMKVAFAIEIEKLTSREYFLALEKKIDQSAPPY